MKMAEKFREWVFEDVLPSIRKNGAYVSPAVTDEQIKKLKEELDQSKKELEETNNQLKNKDKELSRVHDINKELLTYKKLSERNETIYFVSTHDLIRQGLIKIGRTKNIKSRNSGHNTTHPVGDKIKVLYEFKVNDSTLVENTIHKKLAGLRPDKNSEFFMCPYDLLFDIVDMIINYDERTNEAVDRIIDSVYKLKQYEFSHLDWTAGVNMSIFDEKMKLIEGEKLHAEFDMNFATEEQKDAFVRDCILSYHKNISIPQNLPIIVWTAFQPHLIKELNTEKKDFRPSEWRDFFKKAAAAENIQFKLRNS